VTSGRDFQDARGRTVELREYRPEDRGLLLAMYRTFDPEQRAQGIPPVHPLRLQEWVDLLTGEGVNVLAWSGDRVVGHAVLVPDGAGSHELAVFVHQEFPGGGDRHALGAGCAGGGADAGGFGTCGSPWSRGTAGPVRCTAGSGFSARPRTPGRKCGS
jgi:hypothetical protein